MPEEVNVKILQMFGIAHDNIGIDKTTYITGQQTIMEKGFAERQERVGRVQILEAVENIPVEVEEKAQLTFKQLMKMNISELIDFVEEATDEDVDPKTSKKDLANRVLELHNK